MTQANKKEDSLFPTSEEVKALAEALAAPFEADAVKFKPGVVSGTRARALAYLDARAIQDRLDEVMGVLNWQDDYDGLPDGTVICRLRLRLGDEWITKVDVGAPSQQPEEGARRKAAFSGALKRAAVKFGIGRYLYKMPALWHDYDPQKKTWVRPPTLPAEMLPKPKKAVSSRGQAREQEAVKDAGAAKSGAEAKPARQKSAKEPAKESAKEAGHKGGLPANGQELQQRLNAYDSLLAKQGVCRPGELVKHVVQAGVQAGYEPDLATWSGPAITLAVEETKTFESKVRQQGSKQKEVA